VYEKLDLNANYTIIVSDYVADGGDGFSFKKVEKYQSFGECDANIIHRKTFVKDIIIIIKLCTINKFRNNRFKDYRRRVPREVTDMAGSRSSDSTAQRRTVKQVADN